MSAAGRRPGRERSDRRPRVVVVGDLAVDVLATAATPPVPGADVPPRIVTAAGGAGANTAAWLAADGVDVTLVARVGADAAGRAAVAELAAAGVRPVVAVDPEAPTATIVVLVGPGGERTMLSDRGAAARLTVADLPPLDGVDHLHLWRAAAVDVVDTTGAGDAFDAGLLAAWLTGAGPEAALRAGCAAGAEAVSRRGARPPVRRRG